MIDWEKVKAAGVSFVIIRCGYGNNESNQDDEQWQRNVSECERLGIPYGVYLYSYATDTTMAMSEAQHVLRLIGGHSLTYPVYFDMEDNSTIGSDYAAIAQTFCDTIQNAGYAVGVYANLDWWDNYLTNSCFNQWHKWVAQYNSTCDYNGDYAIWQYSSKGSVDGISGSVDMNYLNGNPENHGNSSGAIGDAIKFSSHVQDYGWLSEVYDGAISGTVGMNKHMEAFEVEPSSLDEVNIEYQSFVQKTGWQGFVSNGQVSGTTGENKYIEAIQMKLSGSNAEKYDIYYRTHVANIGWLDWTANGADAGTIGYDYPIQAIQIKIVSKGSAAPGATSIPFYYKNKSVNLTCKAHVSNLGWQDVVQNDEQFGTTGKNLGIEAFTLNTSMQGVGLKYSSYVEGSGWQDEKTTGNVSGTVGAAKSLEAVKISLTGKEKEQYHVYYRVHVSELGWLGWTKDGEAAGTRNYGLKIEAMQVCILPENSDKTPTVGDAFRQRSAEVSYQAHVSNIGWQQYVKDGETAGTTGRALPVEALRISLTGATSLNSVRYQAHVSNIGWQNWIYNNDVAGTTGRALPMEAIKIELTGTMAQQYDIYYRVHSQDYGWLGWARNGGIAGTQGCAKEMEAIEIRLVDKGESFSGYGNTYSYVIK